MLKNNGGKIDNSLPDLTKGTILICQFWGIKKCYHKGELVSSYTTHTSSDSEKGFVYKKDSFFALGAIYGKIY